MFEFGVNAGLGIASWMCGRAVASVAPVVCGGGRIVLWKCESGSGASLGACVLDGVWVAGVVDGLLTNHREQPLSTGPGPSFGRVSDRELLSCQGWRPSGRTARVQRRCERWSEADLSADCASSSRTGRLRLSQCVRSRSISKDHPGGIGDSRCCELRMVSVHGEVRFDEPYPEYRV
jgi:hypothetical protein